MRWLVYRVATETSWRSEVSGTPRKKAARRLLTLALALVAASVLLPAQSNEQGDSEGDFSADRPGFSTPPAVLPPRAAQIEGGVAINVERDGDMRNTTITFGSPLARFGIRRHLELRLGGDGIELLRRSSLGGRDYTAGLSDMTLGAKLELLPEGKLRPAVSVLPSLSVPTGLKAFTSSTYDPGLAVAWLKNLPAHVSVGGTLADTITSNNGVRLSQYSSALCLGFPAPARLSGYAEVYAVGSPGQGMTTTWISDAGVSRAFGANLQLDIEGGRTWQSAAPGWFVAAGFALRQSSPFKR